MEQLLRKQISKYFQPPLCSARWLTLAVRLDVLIALDVLGSAFFP